MSVKPILNVFGVAAAAMMLLGCAAMLDQDGALALAPYRVQDNGRIVVDVNVNGDGPFDFALDTGASISVIHDGLRKQLALQPDPGRTVIIHGAVTSGRFPLLSVDRIAVGREGWVNPRVASMPGKTPAGRGIDGILGVDFLQRYAVGFSTRERVIRLYPPELVGSRTYRGWTSVPLEPEYFGSSGAALYLFEIDIGKQKIPALFDLGAGLNVVNWAAARSLGLEPADLTGDESFSGAIDTTDAVGRFRADKVKTGRVRWRDEEFSVADLEVFETLVNGDAPYAILGAGLFKRRDFIIDFARRRLLVKIAMHESDVPDEDAGS